MTLQEFFKENPKIALGFSGGVDSSYLFYAAKKYGADIKAYFVKSQFQPEFELEDAKEVAAYIGGEENMTILPCNVLEFDDVTANPVDRCYYCKNHIFGGILEQAKADGYTTIIDGTNASDDADDRPGMRALNEMKVLSPLRLCGLTKADVRAASKEAGLSTWNKPSYACLATRIPSGEQITEEKLQRVEGAEAVLTAMGFSDLRVRMRGATALLQIPECQMISAVKMREEILLGLKPYFDDVVLDMKGRNK